MERCGAEWCGMVSRGGERSVVRRGGDGVVSNLERHAVEGSEVEWNGVEWSGGERGGEGWRGDGRRGVA